MNSAQARLPIQSTSFSESAANGRQVNISELMEKSYYSCLSIEMTGKSFNFGFWLELDVVLLLVMFYDGVCFCSRMYRLHIIRRQVKDSGNDVAEEDRPSNAATLSAKKPVLKKCANTEAAALRESVSYSKAERTNLLKAWDYFTLI